MGPRSGTIWAALVSAVAMAAVCGAQPAAPKPRAPTATRPDPASKTGGDAGAKPVDPYELGAQAMRLFEQGEYAAAEGVLLRQLDLQPTNFVVHYNLACCRSMLGDAEGGLARLDKAIELGFVDLRHLKTDPTLRAVRATPRYAELEKRWPEILDAARDDNVERTRKIFRKGYADSRDERLRLVYLSAFDEQSGRQVREEVARLAAWAESSVMPGILDEKEVALDAWVVVVLPTKPDFTRWAVSVFGAGAVQATSAIGGSYQHDNKRLVSMDLGPTLRHEFFHVLHWRDMTRRGQMHAIWIMEGLCSLVEDYDNAGDSIDPASSWRTNAVKRLASTGRLAGIDEIAALTQAKFTGSRPLANYAIARTFFLYLSRRDKLRDWYRVYTTDHERGYDADASGVRAVEAVLEKPIAQVNRDFRAWVKEQPAVPEEIQRGMASLGVEVEAGSGDGPVIVATGRVAADGLRKGDILTAIDGKPVRDLAELVRILSGYRPGERVEVSVRRGKLHQDATVELTAKR